MNPSWMAETRSSVWRWAAIAGLSAGLLLPAEAAKAPKVRAAPGGEAADQPDGELNAKRLIEKAEEILLANDYERGVKMLENVIEQYPQSRWRYKAWLTLGKYAISAQKYPEAIRYLRCLGELVKPDIEPAGDDREWYLESQYLTGVAFFNLRQYGNAFTVLRQITRDYPNSVWANQAYYYIGMSHFAQKNWNKAIESLSLVGTFIDPNSPSVSHVEAGHRFYAKIGDGRRRFWRKTGGPPRRATRRGCSDR
ncbi:MAG: tetratricopeptide repeat protein, partial [Lentisphaerae bacterium]|nr:tetratricopeptide repeat protein [Lentisphaerota bacterium]